MEPAIEIQTAFANLSPGSYQPMTANSNFKAWAYRTVQNEYGVAVELDDPAITCERFATAKMKTATVSLGGRNMNLLVLENSEEALRNQFAWICADFIAPGPEGSYRKQLIENPSQWWKQWKTLIGNSVREKTVHGVLGELTVYQRLLEAGISEVYWAGPDKKSHDIQTGTMDYEVKSTVARYGSAITVSGQHQLEAAPAKPLQLLFCRFESVANGGQSIDSTVNAIKKMRANSDEIELKLSKLGFDAGCSARREQFRLHDQIRSYRVDERFPKITGKSFAEGKIPDQIIQLTYQLELTGLPSEVFNP